MKKIVLIGDSIRIGYDKYVRDALRGTAEVYFPEENCRFAEYVLRYAHEWKEKGGWPDDVDLVHWNAGLWDALELFEDEPLSTLSYYENAIGRIDRRLRLLFPKAKLVFATSTAVLEERFGKDFRRHNRTIEMYNETARRALSGTDTEINDLFSVTKACPESYHSDAVHYYTDEGTVLIGDRVLSVICGRLGISPVSGKRTGDDPHTRGIDDIGY